MEADAPVDRSDDVAAFAPPRLEHPVDARGSSSGPSARTTSAASASAGSAASPQRSDAPGPRSQSGQGTLSTSSGCAPLTTTTPSTLLRPSASSTRGQQLHLLRRRGAVARRGAGGEDDRVDHARGSRAQLQPASAAQRCWTFAMYVCVSWLGARPSRSTMVGPALYAASARSVRWKRSSIRRR